MSIDEAAEICAVIVPMFQKANIKIIKLGLHADTGLEKSLVAGPYHPAFKEIVFGKIYLEKLKKDFAHMKKGDYRLYVNPKLRSQITGQKKANVIALKNMGYNITVVDDGDIKDEEYIIKEVTKCI